MQVTKSNFMRWRVHPALGWLSKHDDDALPPVDSATQAIFDTGHDFEQYAEALFPDGVKLDFDKDDVSSYVTLPARTLKVLGNGAVTVFQGRFEYKELTFICDIIDVVDAQSKTVDLYEIKSSTSVKPEYIVDLAFQTIVLEGLGYVVRNIGVIHVNNQFVRHGDIVPSEITTTEDVTTAVKESIGNTKIQIEEALKTAQLTEMPSLSPALASKQGFAEWLEIYKHIKPFGSDSIYNLAGLNPKIAKDFEEMGITRLVDIPKSYKLNPKQQSQVDANKLGKPIIDKAKINEFIAGIKYPVYFLDYETLGSLVPAFDGLRPFQQLPFQYSIHVLREPGAKLEHYEYLHQDNTNPAKPLTEQLIKDIGTEGSVVVWYEGFEKARNSELGAILPEYKDQLDAINSRVVDLMVPFKNLWYVDARFNGSASIKNVYPALAPGGQSYKELDIQEGASAQRLWMEAVLDGKNTDEKDKIMADLLQYCALDTMAMVEIFRKLKDI